MGPIWTLHHLGRKHDNSWQNWTHRGLRLANWEPLRWAHSLDTGHGVQVSGIPDTAANMMGLCMLVNKLVFCHPCLRIATCHASILTHAMPIYSVMKYNKCLFGGHLNLRQCIRNNSDILAHICTPVESEINSPMKPCGWVANTQSVNSLFMFIQIFLFLSPHMRTNLWWEKFP